MTSFDCQAMPEVVRECFFDSYRRSNNTTVVVYVAEEREPIRNWLIANGANMEDDVIIKYHREEENSSRFFSMEELGLDEDGVFELTEDCSDED